MRYSFDVDNTGTAICSVRQCPEKQLTAATLLFSFGTIPDDNSVCPDSNRRAVRQADMVLQEQLGQTLESEKAGSFQFAASMIIDALQRCNRQIWETGIYLGQGLYLGGVIVYCVGNDFIFFPFGGGTVYTWDGKTLVRQGTPETNDGLIRDAVGSRSTWQPKCWQGRLEAGGRLLCLTDVINNAERCITSIRKGEEPGAHASTVAVLLRRDLEEASVTPTAVLDLQS